MGHKLAQGNNWAEQNKWSSDKLNRRRDQGRSFGDTRQLACCRDGLIHRRDVFGFQSCYDIEFSIDDLRFCYAWKFSEFFGDCVFLTDINQKQKVGYQRVTHRHV